MLDTHTVRTLVLLTSDCKLQAPSQAYKQELYEHSISGISENRLSLQKHQLIIRFKIDVWLYFTAPVAYGKRSADAEPEADAAYFG